MIKEPTKHKYNKEISAAYQLYSEYYLIFWKKIKETPSQVFPQFSTIHQNTEKVEKPKVKQVPVRKGNQQDANETIRHLSEALNNISLSEKIESKQQVFLKKQKHIFQQQPKNKQKIEKQQYPKMVLSSINGLITQSNQKSKSKQIKLTRTSSTKQLKSIIAESAHSYQPLKQQKQQLILTNDTRTEPPSKQQSNQRQSLNKAVTTKNSQSQIDQLRSLYQQSQKRAEMMRKQNQELKSKMNEMSQQMLQQKQMMKQIISSLKQ